MNLSAVIINIPDDYATIQEGINASVNSDTLLVQPDTYIENINYNGKNITVASLFLTTQDTIYISQTIIDGNQNGSVVIFENGENPTAVLCGFTVQNGNTTGNGGGIYCGNATSPNLVNLTISGNSTTGTGSKGGGIHCNNASPSLTNVMIIGNSSDELYGDGGGISCANSSPFIENVTIKNNSAYYDGGGFWCDYNSAPILINIIIENNSSLLGGGVYCYSTTMVLEEVDITGNNAEKGGGIFCNGSSAPSLKEVSINGNTAILYGGGIYCESSSFPSLENVTITDNSAGNGGGIYCSSSSPSLVNSIVSDNTGNYGIYVSSGNPTVTYSDFYNNEGGNFYGVNDSIGVNVTTNANGDSCDIFYNIQLNPLFVDPLYGNFHLNENSPCIDAGDPNSPLDPDGTISDMGAFYYDQGTSIDGDYLNIPHVVRLFQNYPNPFNPTTTINYSLKENSKVLLNIYNIKGQLVKVLVNKTKPAGDHSIVWDGRDSNYKRVSSGLYFYKLNVNNKTEAVKKCLLLK